MEMTLTFAIWFWDIYSPYCLRLVIKYFSSYLRYQFHF